MNTRDLVIKWAEERNITDPYAQFLKLIEETGELSKAIGLGNLEDTTDGIGDCLVVLEILDKQLGIPYNHVEYPTSLTTLELLFSLVERVGTFASHYAGNWGKMYYPADSRECRYFLSMLALSYGLTPEQCLEHAYNEIKDRKGRIINGMFVKEVR